MWTKRSQDGRVMYDRDSSQHKDHGKPDEHNRDKGRSNDLGSKSLKKEEQADNANDNTHRQVVTGYDYIFKPMNAVQAFYRRGNGNGWRDDAVCQQGCCAYDCRYIGLFAKSSDQGE